MLGLGVTGDAVVRHRAAAGDDVTVVEDGPTGEDAYRDRVATALAAGADIVEHPTPSRLTELVRGKPASPSGPRSISPPSKPRLAARSSSP